MKKFAQGFTLVEMLVAITIMGLIGAFSLANFRSFGEDQKLKNAALDIQSLLRTAQTNATTSTKCDTQYNATWQVNITSVSVLAVTSQTSSPSPSSSPNAVYQYPINLQCLESGASRASIKKTITLNTENYTGITITVQSSSIRQATVQTVQEVNPCPQELPVTISFAPISGKADLGGTISSTGTTCGILNFSLTNTKTGSTKTLIMEQGGRVYVQ